MQNILRYKMEPLEGFILKRACYRIMSSAINYLCVSVEIEAAPISAPHYLHPPVSSFTLSVPTVGRVMRHLFRKMLSEPEIFVGDTNFCEVLVDSGYEISVERVKVSLIFIESLVITVNKLIYFSLVEFIIL